MCSYEHFFQFPEYRKATHSNIYTHSFSYHTGNIKTATTSALFLRSYRLSYPVFLDSEVNRLISTFRKLGYQLSFIDNAHFKARKCFYVLSTREHEQYQHTLVLPSICNATTIRKLFNNNNVQIDFTTNNSTCDILRHYITNASCPNSGIYAFPCTRRLYHQKYDIKYKRMNSPLTKHTVDNNPIACQWPIL